MGDRYEQLIPVFMRSGKLLRSRSRAVDDQPGVEAQY